MAKNRRRRFFAKTLAGLKPESQAVDWFDMLTRGLALRIMPSGVRTWYLFYAVAGRPQRLKLGAYRDITLAGARDLVQDHRRDLAKGD